MICPPRIVMALLLLACTCGCQFRPNNNLVTGPAQGGLFSNWTGIGNARVAPPGTFSYQAPGGTQPYYNPSNSSAGPTNQATVGSAVPATGSPNFNNNAPAANGTSAGTLQGTNFGQPQWRTPDAPNGSSFYGSPSPTTTAGLNPTSYQPMAPDYRTTTIDERYDPTRMPASDATMVRAPTSFTPNGNWQMLNPGGGYPLANAPGQFEYRSVPQISGQSLAAAPMTTSAYPPGYGYPAYPYANQSQAVVLAQASTSPELLARDPNFQAGWRDRYTVGTNVTR